MAPTIKEEARLLFDTYSNYVYRGALFLTKCPSTAEDIVQEVWRNANKQRYESRGGFKMKKRAFIICATLVMGLGAMVGARTLLREDDIL